MRDEIDDLVGPSLSPQVATTVERVKARVPDLWRVADVMEPSSSTQHVTVFGGYCRGERFGALGYRLYVLPAPTKGLDKTCGRFDSLLNDRRHASTIAALC